MTSQSVGLVDQFPTHLIDLHAARRMPASKEHLRIRRPGHEVKPVAAGSLRREVAVSSRAPKRLDELDHPVDQGHLAIGMDPMGNLLPPWATFVIVSDLQVVNDGTFNFQKRSVTHLEAHRGWCEGQAM